MTDQPRKRITIDAPASTTVLAARHLDATEGRVQVGSMVDSATRAAISQVLRYIATAHNSPAETDLPASTAPAAAAHPLVKGRCPACRGSSLFLGSGGHVTCARLDCPNPCLADEQLHHTDPTESGHAAARVESGRPRLAAPGVSHPQTGTGMAGTNWTTAGPGRSAGQNLTVTAAPAEHCGHPKPGFLGGTPTECVLRPGHSGSHADHNGTRWWKTTEQALDFHEPDEDPDAVKAAFDAGEKGVTAPPATITDPAWLKRQYVTVISRWWDADDGGATEIADAALAVHDRHLQQIQQRLALADQLHQQHTATLNRIQALAAIHPVSVPTNLIDEALAPGHDDGPSVADCAEADRRWPLEQEGD